MVDTTHCVLGTSMLTNSLVTVVLWHGLQLTHTQFFCRFCEFQTFYVLSLSSSTSQNVAVEVVVTVTTWIIVPNGLCVACNIAHNAILNITPICYPCLLGPDENMTLFFYDDTRLAANENIWSGWGWNPLPTRLCPWAYKSCIPLSWFNHHTSVETLLHNTLDCFRSFKVKLTF